MILNNFRATNYVRDRRDDSLTPEMVLELHRLVTEGTLGDPSAAGRLQGERKGNASASTTRWACSSTAPRRRIRCQRVSKRCVRCTERLLRGSDLNHRQIALLTHALRTPGATYSFRSHATSHNVVYQSARNDLLDLERRGLVVKRKVGRRFTFLPVEDLANRLTEAERT